MKIAKCKQKSILPEVGTLCKIKNEIAPNEKCGGYLVAEKYITNRQAGSKGKYIGFFPGTGGDVWCIEYENGHVCAHSNDEVIDI